MEKKEINKIIEWIKTYVASAKANGVVLGMSGGKDSFVVAKLCTLAVGPENVFGVIMPNGEMKDLTDAITSCESLNIKYEVINIADAYNGVIEKIKPTLEKQGKTLSDISTINTAPRIRMTTLYAIAGSLNYLVANTSNLSEASVGYTTKWGDNVGDFAPIANFTKTEVCEIGIDLGLEKSLVEKTPSDGLSGKSDEDKLGVKYSSIDKLIRTGEKNQDYERIMYLNKISAHKRIGVAKYENNLKNTLK